MLSQLWRYTDVVGKRPIVDNWQNRPLTINQIHGPGVGLILGPLSAGVMALDFDGHAAIDWFCDTIMDFSDLMPTVIWTSGKAGRFQFAYNVPQAYWHQLQTKKVGPDKSLEFRWTGCQSVLPPSLHPDTKKEYTWMIDPMDIDVADMPEKLLNFWYDLCKPEDVITETTQVPGMQKIDHLSDTLAILHQHMPRPNFADWRNIAWAVAKEIGVTDAKLVMRTLWPEIHRGEYDQLYKGINMQRSPTAGTLVYMARQFKPNYLMKISDKDVALKRKIQMLRKNRYY